jgi:uncharacterized membrane protein
MRRVVKTRVSSRLFAFVALLLFSIPGLAQQSLQILQHHLRPAVSSGQAALVGSLPASRQMNLSIVLPLRNQDELASLLSRLYDPSSPYYRHFLSVEEFTAQFGPTAEDYQAVVDFSLAHGLTVKAPPANRMLVPVSGTVAQVEKAFNVSMNDYRHPTEDRTFFSPDREPSLELNVPVAYIAGLDNFSIPRPMMMKAATGQAIAGITGSGPGCPAQLQENNECYTWGASSYLSSDMRAAYYGSTTLTGSGQTVGLMQFDGYNICDVISTFAGAAASSSCVKGVSKNGTSYQLAYTLTAGGTIYDIPINNVLIDGATGAPGQFLPPADDAEQVLDIVQVIGMAPGLSQVRVYIGYSDVDILNAMAAEDSAQQLSISWVWSPADPSTDDFIFLELAAQGQSVFAASGDWGAFDAAYPNYFPAEDAWVAAAGGTSLTTSSAGGSWRAETAWSRSGGGVSPDGIPIPSWEAGVANASNGGSTTLRNVPDVAAEADFDNYDCDMGVCYGYYAGTSFAAPRWAGFMALVNQQAAAAGNPTVGLLGPAIYAIGEGSGSSSEFHDITAGNNYYVPYEPYFNAVPGYDLVTGWGSPNGQNLINALAPPASTGFQLSASPTSMIVDLGGSGTSTITVKDVGGFTGSVNLSVSGLPSGVTSSWSANPTAGSSVLTITANSSAIRGSYQVTITGVSGSVRSKAYLAVEVNAPGFSIAPVYTYMFAIPGYSVTNAIAVTSYAGFTGKVNFAVTSPLPEGLTASWSTDASTGDGLLTVSASDSFPVPNSGASIPVTINVTGSTGAESENTAVSMFVSLPSTFLNLTYSNWDIVPGGSFSAGINILPVGNYTGPVTLSAPQLPPGISASFNPNPTTTGRSELTLTASNSAPLGMYRDIYTIEDEYPRGFQDFGGESEYSLAVTAAPTPFATLDVSPLFLNLTQGGSATATVALNDLNGYTGGATLGAGITPADVTNLTSGVAGLDCGVTASFDPNPMTGTSVMKLNVSSSAPPGFDYVSIGSYNELTAPYILLMLYVAPAPGVKNPSPSFTINASPVAVTVAQGTSVTDTIAVVPQNGFTGSVNLSATGLPNGVTASFVPNPTTGTSVLRLTASSTATAGPATVTVTGTSGNLNASTSIALTVKLPPSFTLSALPSSLTVVQGESTSSTVSVTGSWGFAGAVTLTALNLPSGVTAAWGTNPTTGSSALTLTASSTAATGPATVTIQGAAPTVCGVVCEYISASTTIALTVNVPPSFSLSASLPSLTMVQGSSVTNTISVADAGGFAGSVNLSATGLPNGVTAAFVPNPTTGTSVLRLTASDIAATGPATVTITGTSGSLTASTNIALTVKLPPSFSLSASLPSLTIVQGSSVTNTISVADAGGFAGSVNLSASGLPNGVTAAFVPNPTTGTSVLRLTASSTATVGPATVAVTGTSGTLTASTSIALTVKSPPSFTLSALPSSLTVVQGESTSSTVSVTGNWGFAGAVTLTALNIPSGVTAAWSTNPTTGSSVLTLTASGTAAIGTTNATITGTSGSLTTSTTIALTVNVPPGFTLSPSPLSPATVTPGAAGTSTITVTPAGGFTGSVALTAAITSSPTGAADAPTLSFGSTTPVSITGASAGTATLTIYTTAPTSAALIHPKRPGAPWYVAGDATLACLLLFGIPARRRSWRTMLGLLIFLAFLAGGALGCGGAFSIGRRGDTGNPGTTAGAYTITVTGASSTLTAAGTVTLTVR